MCIAFVTDICRKLAYAKYVMALLAVRVPALGSPLMLADDIY